MAAWNPADKQTEILLSNSNRTATIDTGTTASSAAVRCDSAESTGKLYFEVESDYQTDGSMAIMVATLGATLGDDISSANVWGYQSDGATGGDTASGPTLASYTAGDVVGIALDLDAGKIWFSKNGTWLNSGNPATGASPVFTFTGGGYTLAPYLGLYADVGPPPPPVAATAAFTDADLQYSLPAGFTAWDGTGAAVDYLDIPIHATVSWPAGDLDVPIHASITSAGSLDVPIHASVFDSLETGFWSARVLLDGVDVSATLTGAPEVDGEEGAARVASFSLLPAAGVVDPADWTGVPVSIDLLRVVGGVGIPARQFTGRVDVATFNPVARTVNFSCTDDRQNKVAALSKADIDALTPDALYHVGAQGEIDEHWAYAMARMESQPASLDCGPYGNPRVTPWDGLSTFATFTQTDILDATPEITPPRRTGLVNRVDVAYQYRFYRCRERRAALSWSKSIIGTDALASGYQYPTQDMVEAALDGTGWHRISTAYSPAPTQVAVVSPSGWYVACSGVSTLSALLAQRHAQTVTETYAITVTAPASVAANGELAKPLRGTYATTWTPDQWEDDFTMTTPDASAADVDYGGSQTRAQSDACVETLLAIAKTRILASHRNARVSFTIPCMPELDLIHAVEIDTPAIQATGKVVRVVHRLDIATGQATTRVTLALSGIAASGIVTPDVLDAPAAPDVDTATGTDDWVANIPALGNHVGAVTNHAYADSLMGFLVNAPETITITDGTSSTQGANPYYDADWIYPTTGFRIELPGVADSHRNPLELSQAAAYTVEIPQDPVIQTVS